MKKSYTSAFKTQVILELLKDEKSLNQLASEYSVHPNVVREWKAVALKGFPALFERRDTLADTTALHEQQLQDLCSAMGCQSTARQRANTCKRWTCWRSIRSQT